MNNPKKSLAKSVWNQTCPKCRQGKMFKESAFNLKKFNKMHDKCSACRQPFEPEPGYYTGAMYVSYAIQIAIVIFIFLMIQGVNSNATIGWYLAGIVGTILLLFPFIIRLSRSVWIHLFITYEERIIKETS